MGITANGRSYPHSPQPRRRGHARIQGLSLFPVRLGHWSSYFCPFLVLTTGSPILGQLLQDEDPEKAGRVMQAMLQMIGFLASAFQGIDMQHFSLDDNSSMNFGR